MASPIHDAFNKLIEELYWTDSLEESEERLAVHLEMIDDDLREVLLSERRKFCEDPESIIRIVRLEALAEDAHDEDLSSLLLLQSLIDLLLLAQCTSSWTKMTPREKAKILAPLYRAIYGLKLAGKNYPSSVDKMHLKEAYHMIEIAYARAEKIGLLGEVHDKIEELSIKALQAAEGE